MPRPPVQPAIPAVEVCGVHVRLLAAIALAVTACAPAAPGARLDLDDGWGDAVLPTVPEPQTPPAARLLPAEARKPWAHIAELADLRDLGGLGPSEHLGGGFERHVRINALANGYASGQRRGYSAGALIVQGHRTSPAADATPAANPAPAAAPAPASLATFIMRRSNSGWSFVALDDQLRVATRPSDLRACVRCHAEAPHEGVFAPVELNKPASD